MMDIVYLHGLFGSPSDFDEMNRFLPGRAISLPGHAILDSGQPTEQGPDILHLLLQKLKPYLPCVLIGYSLGGRLALLLQDHYPQLFPKIICLSSHLGAQSDEERLYRQDWEDHWMNYFNTLPKEEIFKLWYAQPLFNSLRLHPKFETILKTRLGLDLREVTKVFDKTRRSQMKTIIPQKNQALFLVGDLDTQVLQHYQKHLLEDQYLVIEKAGHCLHIENPLTCSIEIQSWLERDLCNLQKKPQHQQPAP